MTNTANIFAPTVTEFDGILDTRLEGVAELTREEAEFYREGCMTILGTVEMTLGEAYDLFISVASPEEVAALDRFFEVAQPVLDRRIDAVKDATDAVAGPLPDPIADLIAALQSLYVGTDLEQFLADVAEPALV